MQLSLRISHSTPPSAVSISLKRMTDHIWSLRSTCLVVDTDRVADLVAQFVPDEARGRAGLAADALGDVDQLADFSTVSFA
jgi:hypothetical protein